MAYKREVIGSVKKSKEAGKGDYIQMNMDVTLKKGDYLNLESQKSQQDRIDELLENGKMTAESHAKASERIAKIPAFVRFEIVKVTKD